MKFLTISLPAGQQVPVAAVGNYFRILAGESDPRVTFDFGNKTHETPWKVGIGAALDQEFKMIYLESEAAQTLEIAYGRGRIDDSRLTGDVDVNGLLQVVNAGGNSRSTTNYTIPAATATKILDEDVTRLKASVSFDLTGRIGEDNTVSETDGFPVSGGVWNDDATAELWVYSPGGGTVAVIEDFK